MQEPHAVRQVIAGDEFRMLAGDEQEIAEALILEGLRFVRRNVFGFERDAQDRVVAGEAAVLAVINAFVRQVKGREEPHHLAKPPQSHRSRALAQRFD